MATQLPIGDDYYLFKHDNSMNVSTSETHLLITAHGGYSKKSGSIKVPNWCQLYFYGDHTFTLSDPRVYPVMKGDFQIKSTIPSGGMITDYELSKYQGRHNKGNESYDTIKADIDRNTTAMTDDFEMRNKQGRNSMYFFDVITVRNRVFRKDPTLSDLLAALASSQLRYENIHCSFCRSDMGAANSPSMQAQKWGT